MEREFLAMSASPELQGPTGGLQQWREMYQALMHAPKYHLIFEALLALWIIKLLFMRSYRLKLTKPKDGGGLTEKEKEELIREWVPEPLVPKRAATTLDADAHEWSIERFENQRIILSHNSSSTRTQLLDLATYNFLGLAGNAQVEESARATLKRYGVGSCGPRGFYGTIDVHLELESSLASYLGTEEACIYSYGLATASSIIPAFSKRGDIIFCDEAVNFGIQKGLQASRSVIKFFRHNDVQHLSALLEAQALAELRDPAKARVTKKFIVVEGIYQNTGEFCPLDEIVDFRKRFKVRIFLEESLSFGVLGARGRGITEHFGIPVTAVDLIIGSMENSLGSMGGFCAGKKYIIENNYLSGLGYCFSASLPPIQATAAQTALTYMGDHPEILRNLRSNSNLFRSLLHEKLIGLRYRVQDEVVTFNLTGSYSSPLAYLTAQGVNCGQKSTLTDVLKAKLSKISTVLQRDDHLFIRLPQYLIREEMNPTYLYVTSLKICIKADLTNCEVKTCVEAICSALEKEFQEAEKI